MEEFTLTKQIAKHGNQSIIILPKILEGALKPKTLVELRIRVIKSPEAENE